MFLLRIKGGAVTVQDVLLDVQHALRASALDDEHHRGRQWHVRALVRYRSAQGRRRGSGSLLRRFFRDLSTASMSADTIRNGHENKSIEGYEPGVLRILTAPGQASGNPSRSSHKTIPSLSTTLPHHSPLIVKLNHVFFRFRIRSIPHQRHSFTHLRDRRIQRRGTTDVEFECLGMGLVPYEQEGFEALGD